MKLVSTLCLGCVALALSACGNTAPNPVAPTHASTSFAAGDARGSFMPTSLDGVKLLAKNVELQLPRGCALLGVDKFVEVARLVDDEESDFLAGCNVFDAAGKPRLTLILIRHRTTLETGDDAAMSLRRVPGVIDVKTTTAGPTSGQSVGPEVVVSTNAPTAAKARPSASVYFGAEDGLYVLYAEIDGDLQSLGAWSDTLTSVLRPTPSARPVRWRAPTRLAPSATAVGKHKLRLPEGISAIPSSRRTFGVMVGAEHDPLDVHEARSMLRLKDDAGVAMGGNVYTAKMLAPIAPTPSAVAKLAADVRGVHERESKSVAAKQFAVARVDGTRDDGSHEVFAAFESRGGESIPGEVTVLRMVFTKEKWPAYAPYIDESLASLEPSFGDEPY